MPTDVSCYSVDQEKYAVKFSHNPGHQNGPFMTQLKKHLFFANKKITITQFQHFRKCFPTQYDKIHEKQRHIQSKRHNGSFAIARRRLYNQGGTINCYVSNPRILCHIGEREGGRGGGGWWINRYKIGTTIFSKEFSVTKKGSKWISIERNVGCPKLKVIVGI